MDEQGALRVTVVRHAQALYTDLHLTPRERESIALLQANDLTDEGIRQALVLADALSDGWMNGERFVAWTSPYARCRQTARIVRDRLLMRGISHRSHKEGIVMIPHLEEYRSVGARGKGTTPLFAVERLLHLLARVQVEVPTHLLIVTHDIKTQRLGFGVFGVEQFPNGFPNAVGVELVRAEKDFRATRGVCTDASLQTDEPILAYLAREWGTERDF